MTTQIGLQNQQEAGFVFIDNSENIPCDAESEQEVNFVAQSIISEVGDLVAVPRYAVNILLSACSDVLTGVFSRNIPTLPP